MRRPGARRHCGHRYHRFAQVAEHKRVSDAPAPSPEADSPTRKGESSGGAITMIKFFIIDLEKNIVEAETVKKVEKDSA